jgi:hypothetical protein
MIHTVYWCDFKRNIEGELDFEFEPEAFLFGLMFKKKVHVWVVIRDLDCALTRHFERYGETYHLSQGKTHYHLGM